MLETAEEEGAGGKDDIGRSVGGGGGRERHRFIGNGTSRVDTEAEMTWEGWWEEMEGETAFRSKRNKRRGHRAQEDRWMWPNKMLSLHWKRRWALIRWRGQRAGSRLGEGGKE